MKKFLTFIFILIIAAVAVVFYGDRVGIDVSKYGIDKSKFAIDLSNIQLCKDNCPE
jgi:small basic protein